MDGLWATLGPLVLGSALVPAVPVGGAARRPAIVAAAIGRSAAVVVYLVFVLLTALPTAGIVAAALAVPDRSDRLLQRIAAWLERNNATIVIGVGLVFGLWFLAQALVGLGGHPSP